MDEFLKGVDGERRVTVLARRFWPDRHGGVEERLWRVTNAWAAAGVRVRVVCENRTGAAAEERLGENLEVVRVEPMDAGRLWRVGDWVLMRWWGRVLREHVGGGVLWATEPIGAAACVLGGRGDDLVFNPACCAAAMSDVARRHGGVETLRTGRTLRGLDRYAYRGAARVVVSSENLADQLAGWYGKRAGVSVVPHGVERGVRVERDAARRGFGLGEKGMVVGFVGRLDPCKGLDYALEGFARAGLGADARMLIVGDGPDRERLERLAGSLGLSGRVVFGGRRDDVSAAYSAMDVLVLSSVYESFGNVVREAMAHGVPVLGRKASGERTRPVLNANRELIADGRTGLLTAAHHSGDLASALRLMEKHGWYRALLGERAQVAMAGCGWDRTVAGYERALGWARGGEGAVGGGVESVISGGVGAAA